MTVLHSKMGGYVMNSGLQRLPTPYSTPSPRPLARKWKCYYCLTHGQCNSRPTATFPACTGTKLILLGDRGRHVLNNLHKAAPDCIAAGSQTHDILIASPAPYHYATKPQTNKFNMSKGIVGMWFLGTGSTLQTTLIQ